MWRLASTSSGNAARIMASRLIILTVGLVLSIVLRLLPVTAQQNVEPPKGSSSPANRNQQNKPSNPQTQEPKSKPSDAPTGPVTIQGTITAIQEPSAEQKKRQSEEEAKSVWSKVFAPEQGPNLALTGIGLVGVAIAIGTLKKMERQTKATEIAAEAARISSDVARDTLHITERAYLEVVDWRHDAISPNVPLNISYGIRNSGRTPAFLLESYISRHIDPNAPKASDAVGKVNKHGEFRMGPGVTFTQNVIEMPNFTVTQLQAVKSGSHGLWYFGYIKYRDIFPNTPIRTVNFCVAYDIKKDLLMIEKNGYLYSD